MSAFLFHHWKLDPYTGHLCMYTHERLKKVIAHYILQVVVPERVKDERSQGADNDTIWDGTGGMHG